MSITQETRRESYDAVLPFVGSVQARVYAAVKAHPLGLTAEQVQAAVGCSLNCARSRLTEIYNAGGLIVVGKRQNFADTRNIAVYALPSQLEIE